MRVRGLCLGLVVSQQQPGPSRRAHQTPCGVAASQQEFAGCGRRAFGKVLMCRVALRRALVHPMPVDESGTAEQTEGTRKVYQRALLNGLGVRCRMSVCVCTELEELRVNSVASHCASRVHMARSRMLTKWF
jgi:hypothetical protein